MGALNQPFDFPRHEAEGLLRVDTEPFNFPQGHEPFDKPMALNLSRGKSNGGAFQRILKGTGFGAVEVSRNDPLSHCLPEGGYLETRPQYRFQSIMKYKIHPIYLFDSFK